MAEQMRVMIEVGPKGKKVVAVAPDWPGFSRGAKTEEAAIERLRSYLPRYAPIAELAGMGTEFASIADLDVVERYGGTGSTDFWGISFAYAEIDRQTMLAEELERDLTLMRACWVFFDRVRSSVSEEMRKGPRGGGRDRDRIVWHTLGTEQDWAKGIGVTMPEDVLENQQGLDAYRDAYCDAIRALHAEGKTARKWPLHYMIRHTAFHTLDHAWEMEDKDLSVEQG